MNINNFAAEKLKELRQKKNLTQEELAEDLNITQQQVARYENGLRNFKQEFLFKLANYFKVSINDFFPPLEQFSADMLGENIANKYNNLNQLSIKTGIPNTEISKIISGENKVPRPADLKKLADVLDQDVTDYFVGCGYIETSETDIGDGLFNSGIRFLLNENDRNDLCNILENIWKKDNENITSKDIYLNLFGDEKKDFSYDDVKDILNSNNNLKFDNAELVNIDPDIVRIPVYGTIKAGIPIESQADIIDYIDIPREWTRGGKKFYGLKISGDSMLPKYNENDIVIFEQNNDKELYNGKDCAVMINGNESTFKKVLINEQGVVLQPYNLGFYDVMMFSKKQVEELPVKVVGIAREKRTKL